MDYDLLPTELWHAVCAQLEFQDLASLRLVSKKLADLAAEYLVQEIRFHTSEDSFRRLESIANHPLLRKNVKCLIYEGSILADAGCVHAYGEHYDLEHHKDEKPKQPKSSATERAFRLYERNLAKFQREVERKYQCYRTKYDNQQSFIRAPPTQRLAMSVEKFPALQEIQLKTDARCRHALSDRFMDEFGRDCAVPMEPDPTHTKWQLQHMLLPGGKAKRNLKSLQALTISANFFSDAISPRLLADAFRSLRSIRLEFRLDRQDFINLTSATMKDPYQAITKGHLRTALMAAKDLESLTINFDPRGISGAAVDLEHVLGNGSWRSLKDLDIDFVSCTETKLVDMLKRQPKLKELDIAFINLTEGSWIETITRLRKDLDLNDLTCAGHLEDEDRIWQMDLLSRDIWKFGLRSELADAIRQYVIFEANASDDDIDMPEYDHDWDENPLYEVDEHFWDESELILEYGPLDDDDLTTLGSDTDMETSSSEDSDPDGTMDLDGD